MRRRNIVATIAQPVGRQAPAFDRRASRGRNTVERAINLLKQNRAVTTRYDKRASINDGTVQLAAIRIWLRHLARSKNRLSRYAIRARCRQPRSRRHLSAVALTRREQNRR
ncbi:transposase [Streptomonospora sp. PA3]|nr:transposase [Streptomonospora sp. PA3]